MIKKLSILVTILFSVVLFSCSHVPGGSSSGGTIKKTYTAIVDPTYQILRIMETNGKYRISFAMAVGSYKIAEDGNIVTGMAQKNGNIYTSTNVIHNEHISSKKQTNGTVTVEINRNKANVHVEGVNEGLLDGDYELTLDTNE